MTDRTVIIYPNPQVMREAISARLLLKLSDRLATQSRVDVALTGGTDGIAALAALNDSPLAAAVDWSRVYLWWGDERFVAADDPDRNALQARQAWFGTLQAQGLLPEAHVHEMPADTRSAEQISEADDQANLEAVQHAAAEYDAQIVRELGEQGAFDLILFGVGPDGHFASLFPDHPQVLIDDPLSRVVGLTDSPKMPPMRISLTVPFIRRARKVWVFASGQRKAEAVGHALAGVNNPHVPSSFAAGAKETLWMLDRDAAVNL